jgi:DNA-binding transcriptional regulator YhcF (GntR family)
MKNISKILRAPVKRKIIGFFCENPQSVDSVRGISTWINVKPEVVKKMLEELVMEGILIAHRGSSTTGYAYTQDKKIIEQIEACLSSPNKKNNILNKFLINLRAISRLK